MGKMDKRETLKNLYEGERRLLKNATLSNDKQVKFSFYRGAENFQKLILTQEYSNPINERIEEVVDEIIRVIKEGYLVVLERREDKNYVLVGVGENGEIEGIVANVEKLVEEALKKVSSYGIEKGIIRIDKRSGYVEIYSAKDKIENVSMGRIDLSK